MYNSESGKLLYLSPGCHPKTGTSVTLHFENAPRHLSYIESRPQTQFLEERKCLDITLSIRPASIAYRNIQQTFINSSGGTKTLFQDHG